MIRFSCNGCGKKYLAIDDYAGGRTKCTQCGLVVEIPYQSSQQSPFRMVSSRPPGIDLDMRIEDQSNTYDETPQPLQSELGILSTILGFFGSGLLLLYFFAPLTNDVLKENSGNWSFIEHHGT